VIFEFREFQTVRHYYRCTIQNCTAKRHVTWDCNNEPTVVLVTDHNHSNILSAKGVAKRKLQEIDSDDVTKVPLDGNLKEVLVRDVSDGC
jgi:hypothetical protein